MYRYIGFICWLLTFLAHSQELPPIIQYLPNQYGGGGQNWMISQNNEKHIFVANNEGLLHYSGESWQLYPSPNETILRSVNFVKDKVYTGAYMEFGYWFFNEAKVFTYHSLSDELEEKLLDDEEFWKIIAYKEWILFQSLDRIYLYHTQNKTFKVLTPPSGVFKIFKCGDTLFFQSNNNALYEIKNGNFQLLSLDVNLKRNKIINIFDIPQGYLIHTRNNGFFLLEKGIVKSWDVPATALLKSANSYSSIKLKNNNYAIGTISKGILLLSPEGEVLEVISQLEGLANNTVLSLFEDVAGNLWVGLDNGINCINLKSSIRTFNDDSGLLGTVYASAVFQEKLYIGTNQGLFIKAKGNKGFRFIKGTGGQVWSLFEHDNTLFCGHDSGTFIIKDERATLLSDISGTWNFAEIENDQQMLLQGGYNGFSVLRKTEGEWRFSNTIDDFNISSKHFEIVGNNTAFMSHEYKGVYRIVFNENYTGVNEWIKLESPPKGKEASLVTFEDNLYYFYKEGVFKYDKMSTSFNKDTLLSKVLDDDKYISGKMIVTKDKRLWLFTHDKIVYVTSGKLSKEPVITSLYIPFALRQASNGYENVTFLKDKTFLFGTGNGYFLIDLNSYKNITSTVAINKAVQKQPGNGHLLSFGEHVVLPYTQNSITFNYSTPVYNKYRQVEYQYLLDPFNKTWSNWNERGTSSFDKLPYGDYVFKVRSRTGKNTYSNEASFSFTIDKPWSLSSTALTIYFILFVLLVIVIHYAYRTYYKKQEQELIEENSKKLRLQQMANEREIVKMRNEQLRKDIDSKNRELAVSTMNLINKNEILGRIKKDLQSLNSKGKDLQSVLRTIDQHINEEDNWNIFKDAFNNADKDFLKRVKKKHPELTPNDLRLCAYLRLNLSSKEIAPLLNISPRSVEIKRYRLRKKMKLIHEQSLVTYILEI
jgi:AraC family chitin signaling transcriptional activator